MLLLTKELSIAALVLLFVTCAAHGSRSSGLLPLEKDAGMQGEREGCEEGWLPTHNYCLYYTGLNSARAQLLCAQRGALETRGICVKKPALSAASSPLLEDEEDEQGTLPPSASSSRWTHVCPKGWHQYQDFCFYRPGPVPQVCALLGADYVFNYCVTRVPHQISTDFITTVKRLDGDDYNLHRDTRLCCCMGGGLCK